MNRWLTGLLAVALGSAMGCAKTAPLERPSDAHLHAYKAVHHADYLKVTADSAGGCNNLIHTTKLPTEGTDPVVTPALDHLYTKAVIDLTSGPVVLEIPRVEARYFSIHITDQEHYTIYDEIHPVGTYVFVRKGKEGQVPEGAKVIESPGDYPHLFIRTQVKTQEDRPNALAVQKQIRLTGVRRPLGFDNAIKFTLDTHDVYPQNAGLLESVVDSYSAEDHKKVIDFVGKRMFTIPNNMGGFGPIDSKEPNSNDPEYRACAIIGHLGLPAEHAVYVAGFVNSDGAQLNGDKAETFTIPYKPEGVRNFWSVTRYSFLTRNTLPGKNDMFNAYNTKPNQDGNVTITCSVEDPKEGTYWIPVNPGEPYYLVARYYEPDLKNLPPSLF